MMELWQTEWCPASRRVRQRLTELDVTYVVHQVPVDKADRGALLAATGTDTIPALVLDDGTPVTGEAAIVRLARRALRRPRRRRRAPREGGEGSPPRDAGGSRRAARPSRFPPRND